MASRRRSGAPMSVVVYDRHSLDDADVRVLGPAETSVVVSLTGDHTSPAELARLRPDAVVVGEDEEIVRAKHGPSSVTCRGRASISIALWLADVVIVVRCKRLVMDAILDSWVERVLSEEPASKASARTVDDRTFPIGAAGRRQQAS